jgi:low temperature requirement protein LtrA
MKNWLQPPQLRIGEDSEEHRHATWLELFYDLVFVVAISNLPTIFTIMFHYQDFSAL